MSIEERFFKKRLEELQKEIAELEEAIAECEYGSTLYDHLNYEIEYLSLKLDRMKKEAA